MYVSPTPRQPMQQPAPATRRDEHRARVRDFGVGYGNSSGYAAQRRYASDWTAPRFRCA